MPTYEKASTIQESGMSATDLDIPPDISAITPDWMTAALGKSYPDALVSRVEIVLRDDGTNRRARLALTYAEGQGPATVFVKSCDPAHAEMNLATGGLFNEPRLFSGDVTLPLDHPAVHVALFDEPNLDFLLVMEDVRARGGDPRDSTRPLTVDQAAAGVRGLARLHSHFWGDRLDQSPDLTWVEPFVAWRGMGGGIDVGLSRVSHSIPRAIQEMTGQQIEDYWFAYIGSVNSGVHTLLHGDPHIGNTYVLPDNTVGFLDWQVLRRGNHVIDLGYFLQGAVTIEDRRVCEVDLIDEYHQALELPDDERPSREAVWLRYRASVAHGLAVWMATASSDTWQRPEVSIPLAERYAAAFLDLDTPEALAQLSGDPAL